MNENETIWAEVLLEKARCCACLGSLAGSMVNMGQLDRLATWKHPIAGNVLSSDQRPRAVAVICDSCFDKLADPDQRELGLNDRKPKVKYAIEWKDETQEVVLHYFEDLEELPAIKIDRPINLQFG